MYFIVKNYLCQKPGVEGAYLTPWAEDVKCVGVENLAAEFNPPTLRQLAACFGLHLY